MSNFDDVFETSESTPLQAGSYVTLISAGTPQYVGLDEEATLNHVLMLGNVNYNTGSKFLKNNINLAQTDVVKPGDVITIVAAVKGG